MSALTVGSFCTGIGGLDLAVEAHFGAELAWYSEVEPAPITVLEREWPGVPNLGDLTALDWSQVEPVDIITAGYPCQPFSHAGKRKGASDVRHLWPFIADAVRHLRPRHVVLENVAGHLSLGFGTVLGDLAEAGFDAEWVCLRASEVGACHARARVFIVATDTRSAGTGRDARGLPREAEGARRPNLGVRAALDGGAAPPDTDGGAGPEPHLGQVEPGQRTPRRDDAERRGPVAARWVATLPDGRTIDYGPAVRRWEMLKGEPAPVPRDEKARLNADLPRWMMGYPAGWLDGLGRTGALKAAGNAVVPQQAAAALAELAPLPASCVAAGAGR